MTTSKADLTDSACLVEDTSEREETRHERYRSRLSTAKVFPIHVATVNFRDEGNLAYVVRAAACFGAASVQVVGAVPQYKDLRRLSGNTNHYVPINTHSTPGDLIQFARGRKYKIIAAELTDSSQSLHRFTFPEEPCLLVVGHESTGVPVELVLAADAVISIPMPGVGYCLNTSQTANIILYEYAKQRAAKEGA